MISIVRSKVYLGDGAYCQYDGYDGSVILTTENGIQTTNRIVLEDEVLEVFLRYLMELGKLKVGVDE